MSSVVDKSDSAAEDGQQGWLVISGQGYVGDEQAGRRILLAQTWKQLGRVAQVSVSHHDLLVDGQRWLQPLKVPQLTVTMQLSSRRWKPLMQWQKTAEALMVTTTVRVEDLIVLPEEQRVWRLIRHLGAMLDEVGHEYNLGSPRVRVEIMRGQTLHNVAVPPRQEATGFPPVGALEEDEVLIVRRLPEGDIDNASSKTVLRYGRELETLVSSERAEQLLDGSSGPEFVYWVIPARG